MSVDIQPITRTRGDTYPFTVTLVDDAGTMLDLTGASFVLTVNAEEDPDETQLPEFSLTGVVAAPLTGEIEFTMSESDADLVGLHYYDIQMTDVQGYIRTVMRGPFEMRQDITKNHPTVWLADQTAAEGQIYPVGDDGFWRTGSSAEDNWIYTEIDGRMALTGEWVNEDSMLLSPTGATAQRIPMIRGTYWQETVYLEGNCYVGRYGWHITGAGWGKVFVYPDPAISAGFYYRTFEGINAKIDAVVDTSAWTDGWYVVGFGVGTSGRFYLKAEMEASPVGWVRLGTTDEHVIRESDLPLNTDMIQHRVDAIDPGNVIAAYRYETGHWTMP